MKQLPLKNPGYRHLEKSFREWLDILGYAQSTVYQMPHYAREFLHFLEQQGINHISRLTPGHLNTHYEKLKHRAHTRKPGALSNNYLNKHLQALEKFTGYLRQVGNMEIPRAKLARQHPDTQPVTLLSVTEIKALFKATGAEYYPEGPVWAAIAARDKAMLTVFYSCGLRRNEGHHLDLNDIGFDRQVLHVRKGKNHKERFVPFNSTAKGILQYYVYDQRPYFTGARKQSALFISVKGHRLQSQSMAMRLKAIQKQANDIALQQKETCTEPGRSVTLHALRHSIATHLLAAGMDLEKISRFLGHSSLESTQVYTHLVDLVDESANRTEKPTNAQTPPRTNERTINDEQF